MPIPFLLIGIGAGSAAVGVGKSVKAGFDQKNASETNKQARAIAEEAAALGNASRERSGKAITDLGRKKIWILNNSMTPFVQAFEQLHNIELEDSAGLRELQNFQIDRQSLDELHAMGSIAASLLGGVASGAALGAITAFGAYGGAMTFGAASTGTAIAALNGAVSGRWISGRRGAGHRGRHRRAWRPCGRTGSGGNRIRRRRKGACQQGPGL